MKKPDVKLAPPGVEAEWLTCTPRVVYNGTDRLLRKPSIAGGHPALKDKANIQIYAKLYFGDEALEAYANRNKCGYYFMQKTSLPEDWPTPPNNSSYKLEFTVTKRNGVKSIPDVQGTPVAEYPLESEDAEVELCEKYVSDDIISASTICVTEDIDPISSDKSNIDLE